MGINNPLNRLLVNDWLHRRDGGRRHVRCTPILACTAYGDVWLTTYGDTLGHLWCRAASVLPVVTFWLSVLPTGRSSFLPMVTHLDPLRTAYGDV